MPRHTTTMRGFTLMETITVIAVIAIIMPALYGSIRMLYRVHGSTMTRALALSESTQVVDKISQHVRSSVFGEDGSLPIVSIATSSLTLFTDIDYDGQAERVRYTLTGTTLERGITNPVSGAYPSGTEVTQQVLFGVMNGETQTPLFRYFSATSTEITEDSMKLDVRRVEVRIISASSEQHQTERTTLYSSASIRNLKDTY